jgi:DNA replication protein DnaC
MQTCNICGYHYKRRSCEFCKRIERWNAVVRRKWIERYFPARLQIILKNIPSDNVDLLNQSFYITGEPGTGKTVLAALMLLKKMRENYITQAHRAYMFINVPELLLEIRSCYDVDSERKEADLLKSYKQIDYLVLDDLGAEKASAWALQTFYLLINYRYEHQKITIVTSNLDYYQLVRQLDDVRLVNRFQRGYQLIHKKKTF